MNPDEMERLAKAATPVAWMRADGVDGSISTMTVCVSAKVKELWEKVNPRQIERYTIPLYALSPERILAMIAVIRAADAMRKEFRHGDDHGAWNPYDRARAKLEKMT